MSSRYESAIMHLFTTGLIVLAAYASNAAAARPQYQQPYRRQGPLSNSTTSSDSSTITATSSTSISDTSTLTPILSSSTALSSDTTSSSDSTPPSTTQSSSSSTTSSTSASTPTTSQTVAVPGGTYTAVGCYIDVANNGYPLANAVKVSTSSTTQQCLATCAEASVGGPYGYSGVEGTECFCSNQFTSSAPQSPGSCGSMKRNVFRKRQTGGAITVFQFTPSSTTSSSGTMSSTSSLAVSTSQTAGTLSSSIVSLSTTTASFATSTASSSSSATTDSGSSSMTTSLSTTTSATTDSGSSSMTTSPSTTTSATLSSTSNSQLSTTPSYSAPARPTPTGLQYIVASGDTLASLAQRYGIALSALEAFNPQITDPNSIFPGEYINLPSTNPGTPPTSPNPSYTASYSVRSGDTLSSIAAAFGIPLSSLEAANPNITNPNFIVSGQVINIPSSRVLTYSVKSGDTLFSVASVFGISLAALEAANPQITNFDLIFPGQVINLP